jgi:hypothetical protein
MSEPTNLIITGISLFIGCAFTYFLIYTTHEFALGIVLHRHGKQVEARLAFIHSKRIGLQRQYYFEYRYTVADNNYHFVHFSNAFEYRFHRKQDRLQLLYLPEEPAVARPYTFTFARLGLMVIYAVSGWFFATMLTFLPFLSFRLVYGAWLLLMIFIIRFPVVAMYSFIGRLFEVKIPEDAKRTEA